MVVKATPQQPVSAAMVLLNLGIDAVVLKVMMYSAISAAMVSLQVGMYAVVIKASPH